MNKNFKLTSFEGNNNFNFITNLKIVDNHSVSIEYYISGKIDTIQIPEIQKTPQRKDFLWQNTCFEFFIADAKKTNYYEINISPSGDWNFFEMDDYRVGKRESNLINDIKIDFNKNTKIIKLIANITFQKVFFTPDTLINISSVIINLKNETSYWSINHKNTKPDFHFKNNFVKIL